MSFVVFAKRRYDIIVISMFVSSVCNLERDFECGNSLCIPASFVCDNDDDCGDNSDESVRSLRSLQGH